MKKTTNYFIILLSSILLFSCSYDDSFLKQELEKVKTDISELKKQTSSLQTMVDALNAGKVITEIVQLDDEKGYKITFNDGKSIKILNGKAAPVIGIKEVDGVYYWTLTTEGNTDYLTDKNGQKIRVSGEDGKNGHTPVLSIDAEGYWTVDNQRVKTPDNEFVQARGETFFKTITQDDESVTFVLADDSELVLPKATGTYLYFRNTNNLNTFALHPGDKQQLFIKYANIAKMEITSKPSGWRVNLHRPDKYVMVYVPETAAYGVYEIVLRGVDKNGKVFMAIAKISISSAAGFTDPMGTLILNEGNMTTECGSLIYIAPGGYVFDNLYANINGRQLGNVTQDLFIKDGKIWILSQNGKISSSAEEFDNEGMLVVADLETMKRVAIHDSVFIQEPGETDPRKRYKLSWPTHLAVLNDENIFIRDNLGVSLFNSKTGELTLIPDTRRAAKNRMAVANNKVFVIKSRDLMVFEAGKKEIVHTINMGARISGVLTSKDGNLWVSTTGKPNKIAKVDSRTYAIIKENAISEGKVSAGPWSTPAITAKGDTLYYTGASTVIYRHIFSTGESKKMIDARAVVPNANMVYNAPGVHPLTGDVYLNTIKGFGWDFTINNISVFNFDDKNLPSPLKANYEDHTRFPAGIFFTANFK